MLGIPLLFGMRIDSVAQRATIIGMIKSFKHKGLEQFYQSGSKKGIQAAHSTKF